MLEYPDASHYASHPLLFKDAAEPVLFKDAAEPVLFKDAAEALHHNVCKDAQVSRPGAAQATEAAEAEEAAAEAAAEAGGAEEAAGTSRGASATSTSPAAVVKLQDAVQGVMLSRARWKVAVTAAEAQALASTAEEHRSFEEASLLGRERLEQRVFVLKQRLAARAVDSISRRDGGNIGKVFAAMDVDRSQLLDIKELVSGFSRWI